MDDACKRTEIHLRKKVGKPLKGVFWGTPSLDLMDLAAVTADRMTSTERERDSSS